jgi:hypothetical protein
MVSAIFVKHLDVHVFDARKGYVALDQMDGLLTGGSDARAEAATLFQKKVEST